MTTDTDLAALAKREENALAACKEMAQVIAYQSRESEAIAALARVIACFKVKQEEAKARIVDLEASYAGACIDMERAEKERDAARAELKTMQRERLELEREVSEWRERTNACILAQAEAERERGEAREKLHRFPWSAASSFAEENDALRARVAELEQVVTSYSGKRVELAEHRNCPWDAVSDEQLGEWIIAESHYGGHPGAFGMRLRARVTGKEPA
jgi:chromosome segregation ATPase